jgi:hypothetical protein
MASFGYTEVAMVLWCSVLNDAALVWFYNLFFWQVQTCQTGVVYGYNWLKRTQKFSIVKCKSSDGPVSTASPEVKGVEAEVRNQPSRHKPRKILSLDRRRQHRSSDRARQRHSPDRARQRHSPDRARQRHSPDRARQRHSPDKQSRQGTSPDFDKTSEIKVSKQKYFLHPNVGPIDVQFLIKTNLFRTFT